MMYFVYFFFKHKTAYDVRISYWSSDVCSSEHLSYSGALTENRAENKSLGFNLEWNGPGGVTFELDGHHSTAEVNPVNRFGSSVSLGNAVFGVRNQRIDFENDLPVISYDMYPGIDPLDASMITPTGCAFRNAFSIGSTN